MLVVEAHGLPLERTHLVERLDLDPFDVLHGRHETGDALDIGRIVGEPGTRVKRTQTGFDSAARRSAKRKRGRQVPSRHTLVSRGIRTLDVEQNKIDRDRYVIVARSPRNPEVWIAVCRPISLRRRISSW